MSDIPYKSEKQRRFMHAKHPEIAARWDEEYGGKVTKSKKSKKPSPKAMHKMPNGHMMSDAQMKKMKKGMPKKKGM